MGFTTKEGMVRVDIFKESGKWYSTEEVCMKDQYHLHPVKGLEAALGEQLKLPNGSPRYSGMFAVCLEPYSEHAFPVMVKIPEGA